MQLPIIKKGWRIVIIITMIFIILNPSPTNFKDYIGARTYYSFNRPLDFLVCSVYHNGDIYYLGILKNFIPVYYIGRSYGYQPPSYNPGYYYDSTKVSFTALISNTQNDSINKNDYQLDEANRKKLDAIVLKMQNNNESDGNIKAVVNDFKSKYGRKLNNEPYHGIVYQDLIHK